MTSQHPAENPVFNWQNSPPVWYLAHPLAPDDKYTFEQNMQHVLHMMKLCFEEHFRVIAPWHTMCLVLPDDDGPSRLMGLEVDCKVANMLGKIILTGHKLSSGMAKELDAVRESYDGEIIDLVGKKDIQCRKELYHIFMTKYGTKV